MGSEMCIRDSSSCGGGLVAWFVQVGRAGGHGDAFRDEARHRLRTYPLGAALRETRLATSPGQRAGGAQELHRDAQERTRVAVSGRDAEGGVRLAHGEDL